MPSPNAFTVQLKCYFTSPVTYQMSVSNLSCALNFSSHVDLFNALARLAGGAEQIRPSHPPHSTWDELRPRSPGHVAPHLPISNDRPWGQFEARRRTMASKKRTKLQKSKRLTKVANTTVKKVYQ